MYGSAGGYSSYPISYPSNYTTPNFLGNKRTTTVPTKAPDHFADGKSVAASNVWLLAPAIVGTGAYFFFAIIPRDGTGCDEQEKSIQGKLGSIIYSCIATAGFSSYFYNVLVAADGHLLNVFLPASAAITAQIAYYAAVYTWLYRLDSKSFSVKVDKRNPIDELVAFIYFSITTFATAGGDISPQTITARILVSLQVLFFIYAFTMGMVFFASL